MPSKQLSGSSAQIIEKKVPRVISKDHKELKNKLANRMYSRVFLFSNVIFLKKMRKGKMQRIDPMFFDMYIVYSS